MTNFMRRQGLSLRRKTTMGQKLPADVVPKLISFIAYVKAMRIKNNYPADMMFAMDETACWMDMPSSTTLQEKGSKDVPIRTTGHEKDRFTVCLTAKPSGKKLKPLIVFKGKRMDKSLQNMRGAILNFPQTDG